MPHPTWTQTRPGRWERPLTSLEKFNTIDRNVEKALDRDNWVQTVVAQLEFAPQLGDPVEALKSAWKQLRFHHPEVAAVPYNGQYIYRTGTPESVEMWVAATFVVEDHLSVDQMYGNMPRNEQMMCYFIRSSSEVMIRSPHYRLDARGATFVLDLLIKSLANPHAELEWGTCAKNLSQTVDELLDIPHEYTPEISKIADARLEGLKPRYTPIGLAPTIKSRMPGATKRRMFKYTTPELIAFSKGINQRGWTEPICLHAALITACTMLHPPDQKLSYMASFNNDLRHLIPESSRTKKAPIVSTSTISKEIIVTPSTTLEDHYEQLIPVYEVPSTVIKSQACFLEKLAAEQYPNGREPFASELNGQLQPRIVSIPVQAEELLIPKIDGVVEVKGFWIGSETFTKKIMVHSWLYKMEGYFHVSYNESFWDEEYIDIFVDKMKEAMKSIWLDE